MFELVFPQVAAILAFIFLIAGYIAALIRLTHKKSSLPDRVVALDLMAMLSIGMIVLHAIQTDTAVYMDVAVILGLLAFLGTVAFARFIEKQQIKKVKEKK